MPTATQLDPFTRSYIEAALWSTTDEADEDLRALDDSGYGVEDFHPDTLAEMVADCRDFQESFGEWIDSGCTRQHPADSSDRQLAGFHFWLTRNRHGAGFWDGDWTEPYTETDDDGSPPIVPRYPTVGDYLTEMAHAYGSYDLYVGDDGRIYGS